MKITQETKENIYKVKPYSIETLELKGYKFIENLFCDSSGFGAVDEPALTKPQLMNKLDRILAKYGTVYAFANGVGMFQVDIGIFIKSGKKIAKNIASNVLEVDYPTSTAIRLYDTDILTFEADHITLNNGGYATRTTHKRMNQHLPEGVYVYAKNFETWVHDERGGQVDYKLTNGHKIAS